ncbi:MAG TPA: DMT family transporter [Xanthobacteraceae bacterium]|nr:DMT family transporter [Xanthobacteraceae bacterium]
MSWVVFAFSGPVLWAISVHLDKYLVERFFKESNVAVMLLFTAFVGVLPLPFIWLYEPSVTAPGLGSIALIILAGILYMVAMLLYLQALQTEEASVVAPYFQAGPLFGYGLAYLVLGETLTGRQLAGGVLIVLGALSVSVRFAYGARMFKTRLVVLMLTCGFAGALAGLIFKIFALDVEFWTTTFWMYAGEAIFGCALLLVPTYRRQLLATLRVNTAALLSINGSNELINLGGGLGNRYALMFAPLSIVQAIGSTTTLFVFAFGVVLSLLWPGLGREDLSGRELLKKGIAAALVAVGVALVTH